MVGDVLVVRHDGDQLRPLLENAQVLGEVLEGAADRLVCEIDLGIGRTALVMPLAENYLANKDPDISQTS